MQLKGEKKRLGKTKVLRFLFKVILLGMLLFGVFLGGTLFGFKKFIDAPFPVDDIVYFYQGIPVMIPRGALSKYNNKVWMFKQEFFDKQQKLFDEKRKRNKSI